MKPTHKPMKLKDKIICHVLIACLLVVSTILTVFHLWEDEYVTRP